MNELEKLLDGLEAEQLKMMVLLLVLALKESVSPVPSGYPPNVSMADMASRWATWGVGPKVYP